MTDLEITRLCAEAMGYRAAIGGLQERGETEPRYWRKPDGNCFRMAAYDPLHDDAQAMALVKKFRLGITGPAKYSDGMWAVSGDNGGSLSNDLNRAICECIAKMQRNKT